MAMENKEVIAVSGKVRERKQKIEDEDSQDQRGYVWRGKNENCTSGYGNGGTDAFTGTRGVPETKA